MPIDGPPPTPDPEGANTNTNTNANTNTADTVPLRHNWVSLAGTALAAIAVVGGLISGVGQQFTTTTSAYGGLILLMFAVLFITGALIFGLGIARAAWLRYEHRQRTPLQLWSLNLGSARNRAISLGLLTVSFALVGSLGAAAYHSFHYVESDFFCTNVCHAVMGPEGAAHLTTPHANVACVDCHVGSGAQSFIAAKLNGMRQLLGVITGNFSRPIPTPIHTMRPARETCQACHWPGRYSGFTERTLTYFASDEANTRHRTKMLIKVGGLRDTAVLKGSGIHFHMTVGRKIEFVARDPRKQEIAWIRETDANGKVREFTRAAKQLTEDELRAAEVHTMDCMDCHNRPAHHFNAPMPAMNLLLELGAIDPSIPSIKRRGVEVLSETYESTEAALGAIEAKLTDYYATKHADYFKRHRDKVVTAIAQIKELFKTNFNPEMGVRWSAYPDNIGHMISPGCFRCHNMDLVAKDDGTPIFKTCDSCHLMLEQEASDEPAETGWNEASQSFYHFGTDEKFDQTEYMACVDCHTGGADMY